MARVKQPDRLAEVTEALAIERGGVNRQIANGVRVFTKTFLGPRRITRVDTNHWYHDDQGRSWCGANDGDWADIMSQAFVPRHRLFGNA